MRGLMVGGILAVGMAAAVGARLAIGPDGFGWPPPGAVLELRALRTISGLGVGVALGVAGALLQTLLRNPLASPDLLGVSGGASLGVMAATYAAYATGGVAVGVSLSPWPALIGAGVALAAIYLLGQRAGLIDPIALILVGVVISVVCGSGVLFVQHLLPDRGQSTWGWMLGSLSDEATWPMATALLAAGALAAAAGSAFGSALDAAALGEDEARSVGVPLGVVRAAQLIVAGGLTAGSVVLAGPIGFVGLISPHIVRMLAGPEHRVVVPAAAALGAVVVVAADVLVRAIDLPGGRLPIGVLTTALGGPVLVVLLRREIRGR